VMLFRPISSKVTWFIFHLLFMQRCASPKEASASWPVSGKRPLRTARKARSLLPGIACFVLLSWLIQQSKVQTD